MQCWRLLTASSSMRYPGTTPHLHTCVHPPSARSRGSRSSEPDPPPSCTSDCKDCCLQGNIEFTDTVLNFQTQRSSQPDGCQHVTHLTIKNKLILFTLIKNFLYRRCFMFPWRVHHYKLTQSWLIQIRSPVHSVMEDNSHPECWWTMLEPEHHVPAHSLLLFQMRLMSTDFHICNYS